MTLFSFLISISAFLTLTVTSYSISKYKYGYIDESGKVVINIQYDRATDFKDGLAAIYTEGKWG